MPETPTRLQEWTDASGSASEWPIGTPVMQWIARVLNAGNALAKDYAVVLERLKEESEGRVRVHRALADAIGGGAASRINDGQ